MACPMPWRKRFSRFPAGFLAFTPIGFPGACTAIGAQILMQGIPNRLQKFPLCIGMRRMGAKGEREYRVQLPEFCNSLLRPVSKAFPGLLKCFLFTILQRPDDIEAGQILKLFKAHGSGMSV